MGVSPHHHLANTSTTSSSQDTVNFISSPANTRSPITSDQALRDPLRESAKTSIWYRENNIAILWQLCIAALDGAHPPASSFFCRSGFHVTLLGCDVAAASLNRGLRSRCLTLCFRRDVPSGSGQLGIHTSGRAIGDAFVPSFPLAEVLASQIKEEAAPGLRALATIEPAFLAPPSHDVTVTRRRPRDAWRTRGAFAQPPRRRVSALRRWQLHRSKSHCWNSAHSGGHLPGHEGWSHPILHAQDA